eukprot:6420707-Amphidinium_carterae.1
MDSASGHLRTTLKEYYSDQSWYFPTGCVTPTYSGVLPDEGLAGQPRQMGRGPSCGKGRACRDRPGS